MATCDFGVTELHLRGIGPTECIVLAGLVKVSGALTELDLRQNAISDVGASALGDALRVNGALTVYGVGGL